MKSIKVNILRFELTNDDEISSLLFHSSNCWKWKGWFSLFNMAAMEGWNEMIDLIEQKVKEMSNWFIYVPHRIEQ